MSPETKVIQEQNRTSRGRLHVSAWINPAIIKIFIRVIGTFLVWRQMLKCSENLVTVVRKRQSLSESDFQSLMRSRQHDQMYFSMNRAAFAENSENETFIWQLRLIFFLKMTFKKAIGSYNAKIDPIWFETANSPIRYLWVNDFNQ